MTHGHDDHIGGILKLLSFEDFDFEKNISQVWLNHSIELPISDSKISIRQGVDLKQFLQEKGMCPMTPVTTESGVLTVFGVKLTILSPSKEQYEKEALKYRKEENNRISGKTTDHSKTIEELKEGMHLFEEFKDTSPSNGSSIAFLLEYKERKALFLADAFSSVIENSLKKLEDSEGKKLTVDFVKVSHHGSKRNTSLALLAMIDTQNFIISSNGDNVHNLPDKETLVRIIKNPERVKDKLIDIFFTEKDDILDKIFDVDSAPFKKSKFRVKFPKDDEVLTINW